MRSGCGQRDERVVAQLARQRMLREPRLARGRPQALDRAAVARLAGRARKVPQQVGLVLLGIVGQGRPADRAGGAHHRRDAARGSRDTRPPPRGCRARPSNSRPAPGVGAPAVGGMAMIASRIWRALCAELDSASTLSDDHVIAEAAHVRRGGAGRLQPFLEAFVADAGHHRGDQAVASTVRDRPACRCRRARCRCGSALRRRAVVGNLACARLQHGAVDLAKARPLVLHPACAAGTSASGGVSAE